MVGCGGALRTCLYSLTIHFLLTEELRHVVPMGVFARTRNYLVDPPGEENPENPELAITGEGRGATEHMNTTAMNTSVFVQLTLTEIILLIF